jgi:hypothetical protein
MTHERLSVVRGTLPRAPPNCDGAYRACMAAETVISALTLGTVVVGGGWALYRAERRREFAPRLEFSVDVRFVGRHNGRWIVSLDAAVNNEGQVRHDIRKFEFNLRCLSEDDRIEFSDELGGQLLVPHLLLEGSWLPKWWSATFIEPGLKTVYSFVYALPADARFVLLHGTLDYKMAAHTAERLRLVPEDVDVSPGEAVDTDCS